MQVREAVEQRYSVRSYQDRPVPLDILNEILEAARMAPTGSNRQEWKIIVVTREDLRERLATASRNQAFVAQAPVLLVGVSVNPQRVMPCQVPAYAVDLAIVLDHITLVATARGLGSCWIGAFSQPQVKEILGIPRDYMVVGLLPLGYPRDSMKEKRRKKMEDLICQETFF